MYLPADTLMQILRLIILALMISAFCVTLAAAINGSRPARVGLLVFSLIIIVLIYTATGGKL